VGAFSFNSFGGSSSTATEVLGAHSIAGCHEVHVDTLDLLYKTRDRREDLIEDVPLNIGHEFAARLNNLIEAIGRIQELDGRIRVLLVGVLANDVAHEVTHQVGLSLTLLDQTISHDHMGQRLEVSIVGGRTSQLFSDDIF
jgi:hypothetical protein